MIFFDEPSHIYRLDDPVTGELCISATTFIGLFKPKYDEIFWSYYTGLRYCLEMEKKEFSKYLIIRHKYNFGANKNKTTEEAVDEIRLIANRCGVSNEEVELQQQRALFEWKQKNLKSQDKGTKFHLSKENQILDGKGKEYEGVFARLKEDTTDLSLLHNSMFPTICSELRMYNREFIVSGSADEVIIYPDKSFLINDWKSNIKIDMDNKYDKMKYPVGHLDSCSYNHYALQLSLYAWILEQWGYKQKLLKFTHVVIDENNNVLDSVEYHVRYMKQEIENMLNYYKFNKEKILANYKK